MGEENVVKVEQKVEQKVDEKKEKKVKESKEPKQIHVKCAKAKPNSPIDPRTGTRFEPGSARQLAFEIIYNAVKAGKDVKSIRETLTKTRKDAGAKFNLDAGYLQFIIASHPEIFEVWNNGVMKLLSEPKIDVEAARKFEEERAAKKKKAIEAREVRKVKAEAIKAEKKEKKEQKVEKIEKKEQKVEKIEKKE